MVSQANREGIRRAEVVAVLGGSAVLAGSWVIVAVNHGVPGWEQEFFEWVNDGPDALWPVIWGPMQLGSLAGSLVVVVVTFVVTRQRRLTLAALTASQVAWWSAKVIKGVVARGRPGVARPREAARARERRRLRLGPRGGGVRAGHRPRAVSSASVASGRVHCRVGSGPGEAVLGRAPAARRGGRCRARCAVGHALAMGVRSRRRRPTGSRSPVTLR